MRRGRWRLDCTANQPGVSGRRTQAWGRGNFGVEKYGRGHRGGVMTLAGEKTGNGELNAHPRGGVRA